MKKNGIDHLCFLPCDLLAFGLYDLAENFPVQMRLQQKTAHQISSKLIKKWLIYSHFYNSAFSLYVVTSKASNRKRANRTESKFSQNAQNIILNHPIYAICLPAAPIFFKKIWCENGMKSKIVFLESRPQCNLFSGRIHFSIPRTNPVGPKTDTRE